MGADDEGEGVMDMQDLIRGVMQARASAIADHVAKNNAVIDKLNLMRIIGWVRRMRARGSRRKIDMGHIRWVTERCRSKLEGRLWLLGHRKRDRQDV